MLWFLFGKILYMSAAATCGGFLIYIFSKIFSKVLSKKNGLLSLAFAAFGSCYTFFKRIYSKNGGKAI